MITPAQIRAGRALVGWSQTDLARRAEVTQVTIANIETQKTQASRNTIRRIESALQSQGVEFVGNGVKLSDYDLNHYVGDDAYVRLLDDVYFALNANRGEVLFSGVDERKNVPGLVEKIKKMKAAGITMRLLIEDGNDYILGELKDYRQLPSQYFSNGVTVTYSNKYALAIYSENSMRVHVLNNAHVADTQRRIFQFLWDYGKEPQWSSANRQY